jgi:AcrR family transcriptional regulator
METKNTKNVSTVFFVTIFAAMKNTEAQEKEQKLIEEAHQVFMRYGIKSMTMDDIARQLRISKKTLYSFVSDKTDLVNKCLDYDCLVSISQINEVRNKKLNAIDENFEISSLIVHQLKGIHPSIFYDLEKYYPEAWNKMNSLHYDEAANMMEDNLKRGIAEGLYRDDLNIPIMTRLWVSRINVIFDPSMFPMDKFSLTEVYQEMFIHHILGIASEKGREYLKKKLTKQN